MQKDPRKGSSSSSFSSSSTTTTSTPRRRSGSDAPSISTQRKQFQRKQRAIVEENPKYMKNSVATGRRARIRTKNPKLVYPTLKKNTRSKSSMYRDEGYDGADSTDDRISRFRNTERSGSTRSRGPSSGSSRPSHPKSKSTRNKQ
jgi:hypothetical protein